MENIYMKKTNAKIRIGKDFQASIPELKDSKHDGQKTPHGPPGGKLSKYSDFIESCKREKSKKEILAADSEDEKDDQPYKKRKLN